MQGYKNQTEMTIQYLNDISEKLNTCIKFINPQHLLPILVINLNRKVKNIQCSNGSNGILQKRRYNS